ncbi:Urea transporter [Desulfurobacterium atlanticum]|uniref:Urea transporter n=1 Tax=Desulfurobacterium atlanticum TaxID=240169 RepID=A0A238XUS9_9BACT|nr:Urea transporter [Desulfurobacterium atlanticum]
MESDFSGNKVKSFLLSFLKSYSGIFFISEPLFGFFLFLITLLNPNMALSGFLCVISAYSFARLLGLKDTFLGLDFYIYNPLLVGLAIGYLFKLNLLTFIFIFSLGILTFLMTYTLSSIFSYYLKLPVLSIPFVIGSFIVYLASIRYSNLFVISLYPHYPVFQLHLPDFLKGFFSSLGAILFSPSVFAGLFIFLALFLYSRILTFLAVIGYFSAIFITGLMTGSFVNTFNDISAFNYILIAMAVGGVFLIPSPKSYLFAILSSIIAVPIVESTKAFWQQFGIPVFALPFNTVTLLIVYTLGLISWEYTTKLYRGTPEKTLDYYLTYLKRFPFSTRTLSLPFSGEWTVWQSFDGEWTHRGPWKYAIDFVISDDKGSTFKGDGNSLTDYYAFGKPVLSPVRGRVIKALDRIKDNPPGQADKENNFGNYVLIYDERGFYVLIAHLKENSLKVKSGDWVEKGSIIGLCGNSGYSPQPHIHIHVQLLSDIGSPTVPFSFAPFIRNEREFVDNGVPLRDERVKPVFADKALKKKLNLLIDMVMKYKVVQNDEEMGDVEFAVKMAPDGTFYLTDGSAKLYFAVFNETFYFLNFEGNKDSYLRYLFISGSKIPLFLEKALFWKDYLPLDLLENGMMTAILRFLASFKHDFYEVKAIYECSGNNSISGKVEYPNGFLSTFIKVDSNFGFKEIKIESNKKRLILRRVEDEKVFINGNGNGSAFFTKSIG